MNRLTICFAACVFCVLSMDGYAAQLRLCANEVAVTSSQGQAVTPLPQRQGHPTRTSGSVPHVQIGVEIVPEVLAELDRLAFSLPEVEKRPTIVSLPGTDGMWLREILPVAQPAAIVAGREFAHIHPDGSLHAPLPLQRALELSEKGWGERHPWADRREGWEGLVMLYTPRSMKELKIIYQLIVESYNHVTGRDLRISDC